jgi:energy-coupling factor transport system ATP-binding protein
MSPRCLILDESTALLDPASRQIVLQLVDTLHEQGLAIVTITHDMNEACRAQRVVALDGGKLVMEGTPREVFAQTDRLESMSLSLPSVPALSARLRARGLPLPPDLMSSDELSQALVALREGLR